MLAGYYGHWLETVLMRLTDVQLALPQLLLAIVVVAIAGPSVPNIILVMALTTWPWYSRMFFNTIRSLREMEFITAARTIGASDARMLLRHLLTNQWHVLIVLVAVFIRSALVNEATLSFLGLGIRPPTPSWGSMLREGYQVITIAPWLSVFPGLVLMLIILAINTVGETLRRRFGE
jgi:peptide/nickel transport system permease protein